MDQNALKPHRARRSYTGQFKAEMVAECLRGNVSVAPLALEQGMNANVLRRGIVEHERYAKHVLQDEEVGSVRPTVDMAYANRYPLKAWHTGSVHVRELPMQKHANRKQPPKARKP